MARFDFPQCTSPEDAFKRIANRNRVGRKHNHQARGRAREKQRQGKIAHEAKKLRLLKRYHALVEAYWRGELSGHPNPPTP